MHFRNFKFTIFFSFIKSRTNEGFRKFVKRNYVHMLTITESDHEYPIDENLTIISRVTPNMSHVQQQTN